MLQILLFSIVQLVALTLSGSLLPMAPAPELSTTAPTTTQPTTRTSTTTTTTTQTTTSPAETQVTTQTSTSTAITPTAPDSSIQETESLQNNVLVFLNECIKNPSDNLLRDHFIYLKRYSEQAHFLINIDTLKKIIIHIQELFSNKLFLNAYDKTELEKLLAILRNIYHINDSEYCIALPSRKNISQTDYNQNTTLDLTGCTLVFNQKLLNEDFNETFFETLLNRMKKVFNKEQNQLEDSFFEKLLNRIKEIESAYGLVEPSKQKKESDVFKKLFAQQINAHNLFAADSTSDHNGYTAEDYALATQPWNFFFDGHGAHMHSIAGFFFGSEELWKTLKVLNHISTGYLVILSCYVGGENREVLCNPSLFMKESDVLNPLYKKFEKTLLGFNIAYPIVLTSSSNSILTMNPATLDSITTGLTNINLSENTLIESIIAKDSLYNENQQINKLPLILYPHQTSFRPLQLKKPNRFLSHIINRCPYLNTVTQRTSCCKKKIFSVEEQSVIQTNLSTFSQPLVVTPTNNNTTSLTLLFESWKLNEYEKNLPKVFPVISDTDRIIKENTHGCLDIQYPTFPYFLSQQLGASYHYIPALITKKTDAQLLGESGVFLCLRDLFFNANLRTTKQLFYIKTLIGENDLPKNIFYQLILENIFDKNFPLSGEPIILNDVIILTYYGYLSEEYNILQSSKNPGHSIFCAFSYRQSYYFFELDIEDYIHQKNWNFLRRLESKEAFEKKLSKLEHLACSKIYDRLKSYPESHPQHELIKEYLDRKKSIFLDFENSYPLFKDDHLPEDDHAWEQLPELLKKHGEKQKSIGSIAEHQLKNQETFAPVLKKIEEYQKRPIHERPILEDHENGHPEDSHI